MKKTILFLSILLICFSGFSQLTISFEKDTIVILRDKKNKITSPVLANIDRFNTKAGLTDTFRFATNPAPETTMPGNDFIFKTDDTIPVSSRVSQIKSEVTIKPGENPKGDTLYISIIVSCLNTTTTTSKNLVFEIINRKDEDDDMKNNKFDIGAISVGHSFDFFGKDNALISYADAYIFKPYSIRIGKKVTEKKYGFAIKLYQNKSVTVDSLNNSGSLYKFINQTLINPLQPPVNDSVDLKQQVLTRKTSYKSTNWGMYLRLFKDISYKNDNTKFYLGLHGEFLRRDIQTTYEYTSEKDTVIKIKSNQVAYQAAAPLGKNSIQSELYIAPYLEFVHQDKDISVRFSLIPAGLNLNRSTTLNNTTYGKIFYLGQFDLILNKLNLKLGAECRGLWGAKNQPYWNVFISKSFSWSKLTELIF